VSHIAAMTDTLEEFQKSAHRPRLYLVAGMAILVAVWGGYVGWQHHAKAEPRAATASAPPSPVPVSVATARRRDVPIYVIQHAPSHWMRRISDPSSGVAGFAGGASGGAPGSFALMPRSVLIRGDSG
jgi:hypothetical protein